MSTFNGVVAEFPGIMVDYFRFEPKNAPLACFLSHVHSDHIQGLENLKSPPFIYCSAATKEFLPRLEKFADRINYANDILEATKQTYKHLDRDRNRRLKPLPFNTPCRIELGVNYVIQVTLLDANHCPGSVMFLFEGQGKAVLYTGDVRCEPWLVNSLTQNPCMLQYSAQITTLDKIYIDTSFTDDVAFPTQAEGCQELLRKLLPRFKEDSKDTLYHFQAWTYGYEKVWAVLAKAFDTKIHVDGYKYRLYSSLRAQDPARPYERDVHLTQEAPALVGFMCGNYNQAGCLTDDPDAARFHSCEKGNYCEPIKRAAAAGKVVWIVPVVARLPGGRGDLVEAGIGGGGDEEEQTAELDCRTVEETQALVKFITECDNAIKAGDESAYERCLAAHGISADCGSYEYRHLLNIVLQNIRQKAGSEPSAALKPLKRITFPFSRHSSLPELRHLVEAFKPRDVWPCSESPESWLRRGLSIKHLFGDLCSGDSFVYDNTRLADAADQEKSHHVKEDHALTSSQASSVEQQHAPTSSQTTSTTFETVTVRAVTVAEEVPLPQLQEIVAVEISSDVSHDAVVLCPPSLTSSPPQVSMGRKRDFDDYERDSGGGHDDTDIDSILRDSQDSTATHIGLGIRREAYDSMLGDIAEQEWEPIGLLSTSGHHGSPEIDLGRDGG